METDHIKEKIDSASEQELQSMKTWLFQENIRLRDAFSELEAQKEQMNREKCQFQQEVKLTSQRVTAARQRLKEDELFFQKKMDILKAGFQQLDADRQTLESERRRFHAEKSRTEVSSSTRQGSGSISLFFCGVRNSLALKKRYKDLIKIFHPDNVAGDKELVQQINQEYETLKRHYDS